MNPKDSVDLFFVVTDTLGALLFVLLLLMSLLSWYCTAAKALQLWRIGRQGRQFREHFWRAPDQAVAAPCQPFARLASLALRIHASEVAAGDKGERVLHVMRRVIGETGDQLESGQTLLATVAAVAPFVGLFGTVWGVHHALGAIGSSGAATLEQVAGPVGEALVMTALGLAVAIPAVLAHNAFARTQRRLLARLDAFAHDVHHYLATGQARIGEV